MNKIVIKIFKHLLVITLIFGLGSFYSCEKDDSLTESSQVLSSLEKKYNVKIECKVNKEYTPEEISEIENYIRNFQKEFSVKNAKIKMTKSTLNATNRLKLRSVEEVNEVNFSKWTFDLTWYNCCITLNQGALTGSSWFTGASLYTYEQKSFSSDYPDHAPAVHFEIHGSMVITLAKFLMNITRNCDCTGDANFSTNTGTITVSQSW